MTPNGIKALVCLFGAAIMNGLGMCILMSIAEAAIKELQTPKQNLARDKQLDQLNAAKENQK